MSPALRHGDLIISIKATPRSLKPGRIFVVDHADLGVIVKRLVAERNGRFIFRGDHDSSTPEAVIAPVEAARIRARAVLAIRRGGVRWLR